jgi:hypothetical protein
VVRMAGRDHYFVLVRHGRHARAAGAVADAWLLPAGVGADDASGATVYRDLNGRTFCEVPYPRLRALQGPAGPVGPRGRRAWVRGVTVSLIFGRVGTSPPVRRFRVTPIPGARRR